jgi:hypothetical protein
MTIAKVQYEGVGVRAFSPQLIGQFGNFPASEWRPGSVVAGDAESEFVALMLNVAVGFTLNQGDWLAWDNSYQAVQTLTGAGKHQFGSSVGTFFMGASLDTPAINQQGMAWSFTFTPGLYMVWAQRAGTSLANIATVNAQTKPLNTTAVAGQLNAPAAPLVGSETVSPAFACATTGTFTANVTNGSATLAATANIANLTVGDPISGTGIPTGAVIKDINGSSITISAAATATNAGVTVTWNRAGGVLATTTNGSANLTNVTSINGLYPNQTIAGTNIPGATTILQILGNAAPYTVVMSQAATGSANNVAITPSVYIEAFLRWPAISAQN